MLSWPRNAQKNPSGLETEAGMEERWGMEDSEPRREKALGQEGLGPKACWEASKPQSMEPPLFKATGAGAPGVGDPLVGPHLLR